MIFAQRITVLRGKTVTDRYGNETLDWSDPARIPVDEPVSLQPRMSTETGAADRRDLVITGWKLFTKPGVDLDLTPADRVEYSNLELEVEGEVARWPDPTTGGVHHVEAALRRATG